MIPQGGMAEVLLRLALAVGFGFLIGLDRELKNKPAGLRTLTLVALGSASFALVTVWTAAETAALTGVMTDPLRTIAGVIGGIGVIGAGTIIRSGGSVEGVTTATTIWVSGAIGLACGVGYWQLAGLTTVLGLAVLRLLRLVETVLWRRRHEVHPEHPDRGDEGIDLS